MSKGKVQRPSSSKKSPQHKAVIDQVATKLFQQPNTNTNTIKSTGSDDKVDTKSPQTKPKQEFKTSASPITNKSVPKKADIFNMTIGPSVNVVQNIDNEIFKQLEDGP